MDHSDLYVGAEIHFWYLLERLEPEGYIKFWLCRCICGEERRVREVHLLSESSKSCGCDKSNFGSHGNAKKGQFSKKYKTWRQIKSRCNNPNHKNADIYNGLLCDHWQDFNNFNHDVPEPEDPTLSIDRIDNSKGYEPGNVRWSTMAEQHRNQSNCRWIEFNGEKKLLTDWAKDIGINSTSLSNRIRRHGIEKALTTPKQVPKIKSNKG